MLAVVGEEPITVGDFEAEMSRHTRDSGTHFTTEAQKRALLDEMIEFKILLARAKAAGYDRDPAVRAKLDRLIVDKFKSDHLATNSENVATVADKDAHEFYFENPQRFAVPESVHVAIIYFRVNLRATPEKRTQLREHAESVLAQAQRSDTAGFRELVRRNSDDQATRYFGGDIGWLTQGDHSGGWGSPLEKAAFAISDPGDFAPLVESPQGFYVVKLLEKKPAGVRPFDQVEDTIKYQMAQEKQHQRQIEFIEKMKSGIKIETHPSLLENISVPANVSEQAPPALPRG